MRARRKTKHKKLRIIAIIIVVALIISVIFINHQIKAKLSSIAVYKCKNTATQIIDDSIVKALDNSEFTYDNLINVDKTEDKINSIECNMNEVNKLKSSVISEINSSFDSEEKNSFKISLGTVTGMNILSGFGPKIKISFEKEGSVNAHLISKFDTAGVNQTKHRIYLDISVDFIAISATDTYKTNVDTEFLIAETVIIGEIPETYLNVSKKS